VEWRRFLFAGWPMSNEECFRRRRLPHWDCPGAIYFVTTCLNGSIPAQGLSDLWRFREQIRKEARSPECNLHDWAVRQWKKTFARTEEWLDSRPAVRHLADPAQAQIVVVGLCHFAGVRYDLLSYVVMPSHLHWVFWPREEWVGQFEPKEDRTPRECIMHSLKRYTAPKCNLVRRQLGTFWQDESYDHCVLDWDEFDRINMYIEQNPVKAGLVTTPEAWRFSSAHERFKRQIPPGHPLLAGKAEPAP
jgi:putative transposase